MMGNENKYHRSDANIYSIECGTGNESDGCGGLERGRNHKAEGSIGSKNGLVSLISECYQKIENGDESRAIEKSERSISPRFRAPIETEALAMETIESRTEDLRTGARGIRSALTIRMEDIERPHRKHNCLR
jgi:hypothetical protein